MTAVMLPTFAEMRDERGELPTMTSPLWDRPLVAALIDAGIDLARGCTNCPRKLIDHVGPLIRGGDLHGDGRYPIFGDQVCADAWNDLAKPKPVDLATPDPRWKRNANGSWSGPQVEECACGALLGFEVCACGWVQRESETSWREAAA